MRKFQPILFIIIVCAYLTPLSAAGFIGSVQKEHLSKEQIQQARDIFKKSDEDYERYKKLKGDTRKKISRAWKLTPTNIADIKKTGFSTTDTAEYIKIAGTTYDGSPKHKDILKSAGLERNDIKSIEKAKKANNP